MRRQCPNTAVSHLNIRLEANRLGQATIAMEITEREKRCIASPSLPIGLLEVVPQQETFEIYRGCIWHPERFVHFLHPLGVRSPRIVCVDKSTTGSCIPYSSRLPHPHPYLRSKRKNKAKAKGLLEVTVILSGDKTRRNVPGNAFRRAKARLVKKGMKAGSVGGGTGATGDTDIEGGGARDQNSGRETSSGARRGSESKNEGEDNFDDEVITSARLRCHKLARALSRVTEEDCMSHGSSFVNSTRTFGGRDLESGGGGNSFRSPMTLYEGSEEGKPARVSGDGGKKNVPWSPICGDKTEWSVGEGDRITNAPSGGEEKRSGSLRGKEIVQSTDSLEKARGLSIASRSADCSTSVWGEGCRPSGDGDGSAIPLNRSDDEGHSKPSAYTLNRQRAARNLSDTSSDMSGCVSEGARADRDSSCEEAKRSRFHLGGPFRETSAGRGRWPKRVRNQKGTGRGNEGGGDSDDVKARNARSPVRPTLGRLERFKVDITAYSSSEDIKSDATTVTGGSGRPSRAHRGEISKAPASSPSGVNTHSRPTARKTRHESSKDRPLRNKASEDLAGSSLEDVRTLMRNTAGN